MERTAGYFFKKKISYASLWSRRQGTTTSGYYLLSNGHDHRGLLSDVKLAYCDMELPSAEESIVVQLSDLNRTVAFGAQARRAKTRQI